MTQRTRSADKLAAGNPKIAALERALHEARRAPLLAKAAAAENVAAISLELLRELDDRVAALERLVEGRR